MPAAAGHRSSYGDRDFDDVGDSAKGDASPQDRQFASAKGHGARARGMLVVPDGLALYPI